MPLNVDDVDQQDSVPSEKREQDKFLSFYLIFHHANSFALLYMQSNASLFSGEFFMRIVDGSQGEGGGSVLRLASALALINNEKVKIDNIRRKRQIGRAHV